MGTEAGDFYAVGLRKGRMVWKKHGFGKIQSSATYYGGTVIFGSQNLKISALNLEDGVVKWEFKTNGAVYSTPVLYDNKIYVGCDDTKLYVLKAKNGSLVRSINLTDKIRSTPAVNKDRIVVGCEDGYIYALDAKSGNVVWRHYTSKPVVSSPVIAAEQVVYVGSSDHYFYVLDYETGKVLWDYSSLGSITSSPIVVNEMVLFASNENRLYAYKAEKSTAAHQYDLGKKQIKEGKFSEAIKNLELVLKLNPKNKAARNQIKIAKSRQGESYLKQGNFSRGRKLIEEALILDAGEDEIKDQAMGQLLAYVRKLIKANQLDNAEEVVSSILKLDDRYQPTLEIQSEITFIRGEKLFKAGKYQEALPFLEQAREQGFDTEELDKLIMESKWRTNMIPIIIGASVGLIVLFALLYILYRRMYFKKRLRLADMLMQERKFAEAAQEYAKAAKINKKSRPVKLQLARARIESGDPSAIMLLKDILKMPGGEDEVYAEMAKFYMKRKELSTEAIDAYTKALEKDSYNIKLLTILAQAHIHHKQVRSALQIFEKIAKIYPQNIKLVITEVAKLCKLHPKNTMLLLSLGKFRVMYGEMKEAVQNFRRVRSLEPGKKDILIAAYAQIVEKDSKNIEALIDIGQLTFENNDFKTAAQYLMKAYELAPERPDLQSLIEKAFPEIMKLEPKNIEVGEWLGDYYHKSRRHTDAIGLYQRLAPLSQDKGRFYRKLGDCFLAKNMLDSAYSYYQKLPPNEETKRILYDLAMVYESTELPDKAIEVLESIMAVDVNYQDVTAKQDLNTKMEDLKRKSMMMSKMESNKSSAPLGKPGMAPKTQLSGLGSQIEERYEVVRELGKGGMGVVYCARDTVLDRLVAMKVLAESLTSNEQARKRFLREARATAKLQHPNIVHIYDLGEVNNTSFIAMEYIEGSNLYDLLKTKKKMPLKDIVHYGIQIAQALGVAHEQGIVHRDIKPDNIMINKYGGVKITDFGIAHLMEAKMTMTGAKLGTPLYMSPEQVEGRKIDGRADIYSMGIMLYELAAGRPPFIRGDIAYHQVHTPPPPLSQLNAAVPPEFEKLIMKAIAKKPDERYQNTKELIKDLEKIKVEDTAE